MTKKSKPHLSIHSVQRVTRIKEVSRGRLIVFEGADGSGKATQSELLFKYFKKQRIPAELISFPNYNSNWGKLVKRYLSGDFGDIGEVDPHLASVLYAGDRLLAAGKIRRWLKAGKHVIGDRYADTNVAHQAAKIKNKKEREKFINWLEDFEYNQNKIPREDLVIFLSVPVTTSQKLMRSRKKDIHERDPEYLEEVAKIFEELAKTKKNWRKIDCVQNNRLLTPLQVHEEVLSLLQSYRVVP